MGFENVHVRIGDGKEGWPSQAPFDAIILTTAPEEVPRQLLDQLDPDGTMVVAVGSLFQELTVITKSPDGEVRKRRVEPVRMEPMSVD